MTPPELRAVSAQSRSAGAPDAAGAAPAALAGPDASGTDTETKPHPVGSPEARQASKAPAFLPAKSIGQLPRQSTVASVTEALDRAKQRMEAGEADPVPAAPARKKPSPPPATGCFSWCGERGQTPQAKTPPVDLAPQPQGTAPQIMSMDVDDLEPEQFEIFSCDTSDDDREERDPWLENTDSPARVRKEGPKIRTVHAPSETDKQRPEPAAAPPRLVAVQPEESLLFTGEPGSKPRNKMEISNVSDAAVAIKVETTNPEACFVRPKLAVLEPGETLGVQVMLDTAVESKTPHVFRVMATASERQLSREEWMSLPQDSAQAAHLQVVFEDPATATLNSARSGDGTIEQVGIKVTGAHQCPNCRQKFDTKRALELHWNFIHDPNRHQEED